MTKLTKPLPETLLSVLSVQTLSVSEMKGASPSIPPDDLVEWRKPFIDWLDSTCAFSPRYFGSVARLHIAYCEWEIQYGGVPCTRDAFERMLGELGFLIGEIDGWLRVSGLTLKDHVAPFPRP